MPTVAASADAQFAPRSAAHGSRQQITGAAGGRLARANTAQQRRAQASGSRSCAPMALPTDVFGVSGWLALVTGAAAMLASLVVILCYLAWPDLRSAWRGYVVALSACDFLQGYFYFVVGLRAFRYNDELFCEAHAYVALWSATASFLWTACLTAYVAAFFWRGLPAKLNRAPARRTTAGFALVCFGYPSAACAVVAATGVPMDAGGGGDSADSYGCFIDASWCLARLGALYAPLWACMLVTCVATLVTWRQLTALIVQSAAVRRAQFCRAIRRNSQRRSVSPARCSTRRR